MNRRTFIKRTGGVVVGASVFGLGACEFNSVEPLTAGSAVPFLTPLDDLYFKNGAETSIPDWNVPILNESTWRLQIAGSVANPGEYTYADLATFASQEISVLKTMRCVIDSNDVQGLVGTLLWTGIPLRLLLEESGIDLDATRRLRLFGTDGFANNIPLDAVLTQEPGLVEPLVVTQLNREPVPADHGGPVRLMVHNGFGYKNVKWLSRIEATPDDSVFGTYQDAGFVDDGVMRTVSRSTNPLENSVHPPGPIVIRGFAVSGSGGIAQVDLSINESPFEPAVLETQEEIVAASPLARQAIQVTTPDDYPFPWPGVWRRWEYRLDAGPGTYTVRVRATDTEGSNQPASDDDISDGINSIPTIRFTVQ